MYSTNNLYSPVAVLVLSLFVIIPPALCTVSFSPVAVFVLNSSCFVTSVVILNNVTTLNSHSALYSLFLNIYLFSANAPFTSTSFFTTTVSPSISSSCVTLYFAYTYASPFAGMFSITAYSLVCFI